MCLGELPPAAGADQFPVTTFAPHPQSQGLAFLIDLRLIDPVTGPPQDFREIVVSHSAEFSRNTLIVENPIFQRVFTNSCSEPIKEGGEAPAEDYEGDVKDSALIGAAQRVEHYEIAAYGTVRAMAEKLGDEKAAKLLSQTLQEEKDTDEKLTQLAEAMKVEGGSDKAAAASR